MTSPPIRILRERVLTTTPQPGETVRRVAIIYAVGPRPPQVLFLLESDLPDRVWRNENPGKTDVPKTVQAEGDAKRRELIEADQATRGEPAPRTI